MNEFKMIPTFKNFKQVTIIALLSVILVLLALSWVGFFRADDFSHLVSAKYDTAKNISHILTKPEYSGFYRPMVKVFFQVAMSIFGFNPFGYHLLNAIVFLVSLLTFFFLVQTISRSRLQAYVALLILLLQPNTYLYTVHWFTGSSTNVLVALLLMASISFYVKSVRDGYIHFREYTLALLCFVGALLSKEIAVICIPLLMLYDFLFIWLPSSSKRRTLSLILLRYVPIGFIFTIYLLLRGNAGAVALTGEGNYLPSLGTQILKNALFYFLHLGYLPGILMALSLLFLLGKKVLFKVADLKILLFGILFALLGIMPIVTLGWTSPTWLYLPAVGITISASALVRIVLEEGTKLHVRVLFWGILVSGLFGIGLLSYNLGEARWLKWGTYTKNIVMEIKRLHPTLPHGTIVCFVDGNQGEDYGIDRLLRNHSSSAMKLWYDDISLQAFIIGNLTEIKKRLPNSAMNGTNLLVFKYENGHITEIFFGFPNSFRSIPSNQTRFPSVH